MELPTISTAIIEDEVSVLWDEFQLGKLLDGQLPTGISIIEKKYSPNKAEVKQRKTISKPGYAVLMNRYESRPSEPVVIHRSSLDRLADPLRGRYSNYDAYCPKQEELAGPETISPTFHDSKRKVSKSPKKSNAVDSSFFLTGTAESDDEDEIDNMVSIQIPNDLSKVRRRVVDVVNSRKAPVGISLKKRIEKQLNNQMKVKSKPGKKDSSFQRKEWDDKLFFLPEKNAKFSSRKSKTETNSSIPLKANLKMKKNVKSSGYGKDFPGRAAGLAAMDAKASQMENVAGSAGERAEATIIKLRESVLARKRAIDGEIGKKPKSQIGNTARMKSKDVKNQAQNPLGIGKVKIRGGALMGGGGSAAGCDHVEKRHEAAKLSMQRSKSTVNLHEPVKKTFLEERVTARGTLKHSSGSGPPSLGIGKGQRSSRSAPSLLSGLERIAEHSRGVGALADSSGPASESKTSFIRNKYAGLKQAATEVATGGGAAGSYNDILGSGIEYSPSSNVECAKLPATRGSKYAWASNGTNGANNGFSSPSIGPSSSSKKLGLSLQNSDSGMKRGGGGGSADSTSSSSRHLEIALDCESESPNYMPGAVPRKPTTEIIQVLERANANVVARPKDMAEDNTVAKLMQYAKRIEGHLSVAASLSSQYKDLGR